jgi:hypothetical protein
MANLAAPYGLRPVRNLISSDANFATNMYFIAQADTAAYFIGDTVVSTTTSDLTTGCSGVTLFGSRNAASSSGSPRGVIVGIGTRGGTSGFAAPLMADANALSTISIPATKTQDYFVQVCDDPNVVFQGQVNTIAATAFNKNAPLFVANAPASPIFNSASYVQGSAAATTQALPLKIIGAPWRQDNDLTGTGANADVYVIFNQHELGGPNTAGV